MSKTKNIRFSLKLLLPRIIYPILLCISLNFFLLPNSTYAGTSLAVTIDGDTQEWNGLSPTATDSVGDVAYGDIDFKKLWIANDEEALYLLIEVKRETILQNPTSYAAGNDIILYIDGDNSSSTGSPISGIGADLIIEFGYKSATLYPGGSLSLNEVGLLSGPTHSADTFEIKIPFDVRPDFGTPVHVITAPTIKLLFIESSGTDRIPNTGSIAYSLSTQSVPPPDPISFTRMNAKDIRILSHNVLNSTPVTNPAPFKRYLNAFQPDIIGFQELSGWTANQAKSFIESILPTGPGEQWNAIQIDDIITISRWQIISYAFIDNNLAVLIKLPADRSSHNLVLFNAHTPASDNDAGRDYEHDHISATWRNLLNNAGPFTIKPDDAVVMLGDFNMVGYVRQLKTLRDGDIIDNVTWGVDFSPGRQNGSLISVPLRHSHTRSKYTWRRDSGSYTPGKLDYILFSDDVATLKRNFALYTPEVPSGVLNTYGILSQDSVDASDHLVIITDLEFERKSSFVNDFSLY